MYKKKKVSYLGYGGCREALNADRTKSGLVGHYQVSPYWDDAKGARKVYMKCEATKTCYPDIHFALGGNHQLKIIYK